MQLAYNTSVGQLMSMLIVFIFLLFLSLRPTVKNCGSVNTHEKVFRKSNLEVH